MDGGNPVKTGTSKITITVLDFNDNVPSFENSFYKIAIKENSANGSFVIATKATDTDEGPNGEIEYSLGVHTPPSVLALFHIDPVTGDIYLKQQLNYETQTSYRIDISAKDKGLPKMEGRCSVQVDVLDVNDNAPEIVLTSKSTSVPEDSRSGTVVALLSVRDLDSVFDKNLYKVSLPENTAKDTFVIKITATDADEGPNGEVELSFGSRTPDSVLSLVLSKSLDREKKPTHQLQLTAIDGGNPVKSGISQITIHVLDINDNFPVFDKNVYKVSISENSVQGASIVKLSAKDTDEGLNGEIEYSFGTHTPDVVLSVFDIDALTGEIRLTGKLDFETNANYEIDICARDKGTPRMEGHCTVHIEVLDVNDNVPNIFLTSQPNPVPEDAPSGTVVALISARDLDSGDNGKVTLHKDECFSLKIKELANGRKVPELVLEKPLDREKQSVHQLLLTALDGGNPVKTGTSQIIVTVLDNNDNVPTFKKPLYKVTVPENSQSGFMLTKVEATDPDEGVNGEIEYSFADHTPETLMSIFQINSVTGEIFLIGQLDYENSATHEIDITAKDKGIPENEGHCRVQVEIIDINDNAPEIVLTSKPSKVPEDAPSGTVVALLTARDLDSGDNGKVTLQLPKGSPFNLKPSFSNNYALVTAGALDRETFSEYNVEITATDSGSPPLSTKKTINVTVTDVNDNPPVHLFLLSFFSFITLHYFCFV
uniref:Cadherin domain-containing protein n=1 Tax=Stegastes partitus TaxID=144197 RepID=A0A3B5AWE4_9TELE